MKVSIKSHIYEVGHHLLMLKNVVIMFQILLKVGQFRNRCEQSSLFSLQAIHICGTKILLLESLFLVGSPSTQRFHRKV